MTKIVVNRCHGGYGLSHEAMLRICELKQMSVFFHEEDGFYYYYTAPYEHLSEMDRSELYLSEYSFARDDKELIQTVEELGDMASGSLAYLSIIEIPDGVEWLIQEHGGYEIIAEKHRTW